MQQVCKERTTMTLSISKKGNQMFYTLLDISNSTQPLMNKTQILIQIQIMHKGYGPFFSQI
jgi:hypothetical protein